MDEGGERLGRGVGRRQPINQALLAGQLWPGPLPLNIASEGCTQHTPAITLSLNQLRLLNANIKIILGNFPRGRLLDYVSC